MRLKTTIGNWINDLPFFLRLPHGRKEKIGILLTFIRLSLIYVIYIRVLGRRRSSMHFLGFKVSGFDYETMYYLFEEIFFRGEYAFTSKKSIPRILDCGANIGYATIFFKWRYPDAVIDCFEPDPTTFRTLQENMERNGISNVSLHNTALATAEGMVSFFIDEELDGSLSMSTHPKRLSSKCIDVRTESLIKYIQDGDVDFLKLDVEGSESEIIKQLDSLSMFTHIAEMAIEYHHQIGSSPSSLGDFLAIIEKNGFQYQLNARSIPTCAHDRFQDVNIFCYKRTS